MARRRNIARSFTRSDPQQLTAGSRRSLRKAVLQDTSTRASTSMSFSVNVFTNAQLSVIEGDRRLLAAWRRIVRNYAAILQRRARQLSRPTYDTGLFSSSWTAAVRGEGADLRVVLANLTPYSDYVHRSGESRTVVDRYIRPMVIEERARFLRDVAGPGPLTAAIRRRIVASMGER